MDGTCIFEYKTRPAFGCIGEPGGYSICVFKSGDVVKCDYVFGDDDPRNETILATMPELAKTIEGIVNKHAEELKGIPNELDNGTDDGSCDYFRFGEKQISAWTIKRTLPDEVWIENPQYYEEFKENIKHENHVLDVYDEVAAEINKRDVGIQLKTL